MKTVRFAELVAQAGAPATHQLWLPPAKDAAFQRARREHRVLTVHQQNVGSKKDYGVVGFHEEPQAQFLIFPRSLRDFEGRRVIGIDYGLLKPEQRAASPAGRAAKRSRAQPAPATPLAVEVAAFSSRVPSRRSAVQPTRGSGAERKPAATPVLASPVARELSRALKELKAGKTVAAYERLQRLLPINRG